MSPEWANQAPTVDQIFQDIQGSDLIDTRARQAAAFELLRDAIQAWEGTTNIYQWPPLGAQRFREYNEAYSRQPYDVQFNEGACKGNACIRTQFFQRQGYYKTNPAFIREVIGRYFEPQYVQPVLDRMVKLYGPGFKKFASSPQSPTASSAKSTPTQAQLQNNPRQQKATSTKFVAPFIYTFVALIVISLFFWWMLSPGKPPPDPRPPLSDNYGSADWAAWEKKPLSPVTVMRGVNFGKSSRPGLPPDAQGAPITSFPEAHTLIVARTRAGKGTRVIVPTLLRYGHSMLVIDPKGENAAITARTRRDQLGQAVHIVNPWGEMADLYTRLGFAPATFNPLDAIDRDDLNAVAVAQTLAATICPIANEKDKFWQGSAANVLAAVFLWIADHPGEKKTLARAREIVTQSRSDFLKTLTQMVTAKEAYQGAIKEMVSQYIDLAPETYSGIMSNLAENTKFLSDPRIKNSTASSSFSLQKLRDVLITVYLVIPHDRIQTHATWLRLVIASAMQAIKGRNALTSEPHHRCMFLIDEFGSIGNIPDIPRDIALMSGYGLDFTLIVQGIDQLKHHYGDAQGTILSNCGFKWFCHVNELETAKYLSESLGKATVRTVGKSMSSGQNPGGATEGTSTTFGEVGRSLLTPDEVLNLGRDVAILLNPAGFPHYLRPVDYWKLTDTYSHLKQEYAHLYWAPPLAYDLNPYVASSESAGPGAGEERSQQRGPSRTRMSPDEARAILEVSVKATADEIRTAYRRLMAKVHPDKGGSKVFAQQLNAAKAVLLGE
jgi:type IV secretory pathway TraG/TraD family ATPase VirD4